MPTQAEFLRVTRLEQRRAIARHKSQTYFDPRREHPDAAIARIAGSVMPGRSTMLCPVPMSADEWANSGVAQRQDELMRAIAHYV